jgi:hypothetical protein
MPYPQIDHRDVVLRPLAERASKYSIDEIMVDPDAPVPDAGSLSDRVVRVAEEIHHARRRGASVILAYGAHLVKNGLGPVVTRMMEAGWITHLATNGAGTIHDWEYAFQGRSEEDVRANVALGCFGAWEETGRFIHLAVLTGALKGMGYGESLGRFITGNGCDVPDISDLTSAMRRWARSPTDSPAMPAYAELLQVVSRFDIPSGRWQVEHPFRESSLTAQAYRLGIPLTVHPGIGYDIIHTHHLANGAAVGRGADIDFRVFARGVVDLDGGVFLSVGSAVMAPQVFEKALSLANNLRIQENRRAIHAFIVVNDLSPMTWDWSKGEPPKENPAYYLRFCKSFSRMGGEMVYVDGDNRVFLHNLYQMLREM